MLVSWSITKSFSFLFTICLFYSANGQLNDSLSFNIDSVLIKAKKKISDNVFESTIEVLQNNNSLSENIKNESIIYIKEYGNGQLNSISIKGFQANQSDINWNGVRTNSPMLGQSDLSIISINKENKLSLNDDNQRNLSSSVDVNQNINFRKKIQLKVESQVGSFGSSNGGIDFLFGNHNFYNYSSVSYNASRNDFEYINPSLPNQQVSKQKNAETAQFNFEEIFAFRFLKNNQLTFLSKINYSDRNIAPSLFENSSSENQKDYLALAKIEWNHDNLIKQISLKANTAVIHQNINYRFSNKVAPAVSKSNSWQSNLHFTKKKSQKWVYEASISNDFQTGISLNYNESKKRNQLQFQNHFKLSILKNLDISLGFSQFLVNDKLSNFLPKSFIQYRLKELPASINFKFDFQAKTKYPSLNDLYWSPGGNEDIQPENSHNIKLQIELKRKRKKWEINNLFEWYNAWISNYIQWQPTQNIYWSAKNVSDVFSRGFSNTLQVKNHFKNKISLMNSFGISHNRIGSLETQEQLIYVPYIQLNLNTQIKNRWVNIGINQHFSGERFASINHSQILEKYYLLDIHLDKEFVLKNKDQINIGAAFKNILNTNYYTVINRPLAGFNFHFSINYIFDFNKKKL